MHGIDGSGQMVTGDPGGRWSVAEGAGDEKVDAFHFLWREVRRHGDGGAGVGVPRCGQRHGVVREASAGRAGATGRAACLRRHPQAAISAGGLAGELHEHGAVATKQRARGEERGPMKRRRVRGDFDATAVGGQQAGGPLVGPWAVNGG